MRRCLRGPSRGATACVPCNETKPSGRGTRDARARGSVLIIAMVILFALAAMTLALAHGARIDAGASANRAAALEADAIARGAEAWVLQLLLNEGPAVTERAEGEFEQRPLGAGFFWIVRPDYGDPSLPRFGLTDEAGKLNVNEATLRSLRLLPGMVDEVAGAIVDWRDENDEVAANGAESPHYLALEEPYEAKNGPFEFVEELLLVRGVERAWLFGDGTADAGATRIGLGAAFGEAALRHGLFDYLTVHSVDPGLDRDGAETINANVRNERDRLREKLGERLTQSRADEIVDAIGGAELRDVFDLYYRASLEPDELRQIEDVVRTTTQVRRRGTVNVNAAPREVLLCVEGMTEEAAETLLSYRPDAAARHPGTMTWVVEALGQRAIGLGESLVARSYQYTADVVAVSGNGRAFRRVRLVIDASGDTPRVIYRRDVTHRGWPLEAELLNSLRRGEGPGAGTVFGRMR